MRLAIALVAAFAVLTTGVGAFAQEVWKTRPVEDIGAFMAAIAEKRAPAPSGIPDMLTASAPGSSAIELAWYSQPTNRYRHGVLGDRTEGGALVVQLADGREVTYPLPETQVFEDIAPRLADLDGDGSPEVVCILSSIDRGASVAIFALSGDALVKTASTFIGQPNRWLNIAGIAKFTGGFAPDIAYVATPHIGGTLGFLRYVPNSIDLLAAVPGFSNHVIGSTELRLSAVADVDADGKADIAVPSADRMALRIMGFGSQGLSELGNARLPAAIDKAILVTGEGRNAVFTVGLEDGSVHEIYR
jgi:hypothetical protein